MALLLNSYTPVTVSDWFSDPCHGVQATFFVLLFPGVGFQPDSGDSASPQEADASHPHELAEQSKALKAAHTIEAVPQRLTTRSAARAEEPIAARIRHRIKESAMLLPDDDPVVPAAAVQPSRYAASPVPAQLGLLEIWRPHVPTKPKTYRQEHVSPDERTPKRQMRYGLSREYVGAGGIALQT